MLLRADFNVPLRDGEIEDDLRITASLPTIEWLRARHCEIVCCSHLGRPKGKVDPKYSLAPVAAAARASCSASRSRSRPGSPTSSRSQQRAAPRAGRGHAGREPALRPGRGGERSRRSRRTSPSSATCTSNDAFGAAHRAHASIVGPPRVLPSAAGRLLAREVEVLGALLDAPKRPFVVVLGGVKVSDKLGVIDALLDTLRPAADRRRDGVHVPRRAGRSRRRLARGGRSGRALPAAARRRARS